MNTNQEQPKLEPEPAKRGDRVDQKQGPNPEIFYWLIVLECLAAAASCAVAPWLSRTLKGVDGTIMVGVVGAGWGRLLPLLVRVPSRNVEGLGIPGVSGKKPGMAEI